MTYVAADASTSTDASPSAIGARKLTSDVWNHFEERKLIEWIRQFAIIIEMAEECLSQDMDLSGLLLLYSSPGDAEGIIKLVPLAKEQGNNNIAFLCLLMLSKMEDCLDRDPYFTIIAISHSRSCTNGKVISSKKNIRNCIILEIKYKYSYCASRICAFLSVGLGFVKLAFTITKCTSADRKVKMGRGVSCGGGQSSLGYLFGSGEAPKSAEPVQKPTFKSTGEPAEPLQKPTPATQVDNKQIPAGIHGNLANNYQRVDESGK
ncbi:hypothetical protein ZIOFF_014180 [Zingiber officinale]|uniref:COPA/B TPR domain-containing protein n=1 Tax=Zingiber officinale TaxID=94328 RepID=A0A8J5HPR3_ZINOF|nr:hypothetical protein ZIOFF_014180 [Zingiber officinale]